MPKEYAFLNIQCRPNGEGPPKDFLAGDKGKHNPISPLFDHLQDLYPWLRENGWKPDEYEGVRYIPFRYSREAQTFALRLDDDEDIGDAHYLLDTEGNFTAKQRGDLTGVRLFATAGEAIGEAREHDAKLYVCRLRNGDITYEEPV